MQGFQPDTFGWIRAQQNVVLSAETILKLLSVEIKSPNTTVDVELSFREQTCSLHLVVQPATASTNHDWSRCDSFQVGDGWAISTTHIPHVIESLLQKDGLAADDINSGKPVSFDIDLVSNSSRLAEPNPRRLADYLLARGTATQSVRPFLLLPRADLPLFPYQRVGIEWLRNNERGILADDMGLGKTLQAIVALRSLLFDGIVCKILVVCPKSLLSNWESELTKWAPDLNYVRMVPSPSIAEMAWAAVLESAHVLITTYEHLRNPQPALVVKGVDLLIADEAHRIRNEHSLSARGIRAVRTQRFWALTGTPIERDPIDLATLLSIVCPKSCSPSDAKLSPSTIRSMARPFILRRLKADVLTQLPPVIENRQTLELLPQQRRAYEAALAQSKAATDDTQLLALIGRLRSICDFAPQTKESAKLQRIFEILSAIRENGEKAIVFSYLIEPLKLVRLLVSKHFGASAYRTLSGDQTPTVRQASVEEFKSQSAVSFLLASSRVGGEGLTLTEANHVIFFNEWWNPSSNDQARDRVVRLGQKKGVVVYTFVCRNTIEDSLLKILSKKRETFDLIVNALASSGSAASISEIITELRAALALHGTPAAT